jgi:hypothetical protein
MAERLQRLLDSGFSTLEAPPQQLVRPDHSKRSRRIITDFTFCPFVTEPLSSDFGFDRNPSDLYRQHEGRVRQYEHIDDMGALMRSRILAVPENAAMWGFEAVLDQGSSDPAQVLQVGVVRQVPSRLSSSRQADVFSESLGTAVPAVHRSRRQLSSKVTQRFAFERIIYMSWRLAERWSLSSVLIAGDKATTATWPVLWQGWS